jgi:hypothetical protein
MREIVHIQVCICICICFYCAFFCVSFHFKRVKLSLKLRELNLRNNKSNTVSLILCHSFTIFSYCNMAYIIIPTVYIKNYCIILTKTYFVSIFCLFFLLPFLLVFFFFFVCVFFPFLEISNLLIFSVFCFRIFFFCLEQFFSSS